MKIRQHGNSLSDFYRSGAGVVHLFKEKSQWKATGGLGNDRVGFKSGEVPKPRQHDSDCLSVREFRVFEKIVNVRGDAVSSLPVPHICGGSQNGRSFYQFSQHSQVYGVFLQFQLALKAYNLHQPSGFLEGGSFPDSLRQEV